MWESQSPHDELEFEADLIASTNEMVYNNNIEMRKQISFNSRPFEKVIFEDDYNPRNSRALDESFTSGLELDLDFDDFLDQYDRESQLTHL